DWTAVLMTADAEPGDAADVALAAASGMLLPIGLGVGVFGLLVLVAAGLALAMAFGRAAGARAPEATPVVTGRAGSYPVRLDARLEPGLSPWLWLVKWVLVSPHMTVRGFLR